MTSIAGAQRPLKSDEWLTPPRLIELLGPFDMDPCCPEKMPWRTAPTMLTRAQNGLEHAWSGRVWLNPPYGRETGRWLRKLAAHGSGIALTFARTETQMFFDSVWNYAKAIVFIRGRLTFLDVEGKEAPFNCGGPSVLIAYDTVDAARLEYSARTFKLGRYVAL